jgi:hypothetical protein
MNEYNSFGFDGTIRNYPYHYTKKISFIQKNINFFNDDNNTNLSFLINKHDNIFLKIDIEGGEYPWLLQIDENELNKFKQIVIEFHGITDDGWNSTYNNKIKCLEKLLRTHYIVHAHGNNHGPVINNIPDVIELSYVNKNYFKCQKIIWGNIISLGMLIRLLFLSRKNFDLVLVQSMYQFNSTFAALICRVKKIPYILRPHGTLDPVLLYRRLVPLKKLYIDSRDRTPDSVSASNFKIALPYSIHMPDNTVFFITDVCIPHVLKTIETDFNVICDK